MSFYRRCLFRIGLMGSAIVVLSINCAPPHQLHRFEDCQELELFLKEQILHPAVQNDGGGVNFFMGCQSQDMAAAPAERTGMEETADSSSAAGTKRSFTTTNVQEVGVDEADFVKNDGDYIYMLRRGHLMVLRTWPADQTHVVADILVDEQPAADGFVGNPFTMFFDAPRLLVVSSSGPAWNPVREGSLDAPWTGGVILSLYDIHQPGTPELLRRVRIDGSYIDARRVGDEVLLVTNSQLAWPMLEQEPFSDDKNRRILDQVGLDGMLPGLEDQIFAVDDKPRKKRACSCANTYAPQATDGRNLVLVHSISMADDQADIRSTTVVSQWSQVYSSEKNMYLAATEWNDGGFFSPEFAQTRIHKFQAFQGKGAAEYVATGVVEGQILNQFSMDERGEDFRIVVTTDSEGLSSSLLVINQEGDALVEVGRVEEIGRDESVQSVRFIGDKAYVVTYPSPWWGAVPPLPPNGFWDPLFVIDLADAHNPKIRGELEVAGYSTYIHPLGEDHLLTIGVDTDSNNRVLGLSLSIFDVADPDHPSLAHRTRMGDGFSFSEALNNHHAFTFFPEQKALGIPLQLADMDRSTGSWGGLDSTGLEVYRVDVEQGFTHLGRIEQKDFYPEGEVNFQNIQCIDVRRSVMIADEDAGAFVYAVSTGGLSVAEITEGLPLVSSVPFLSPQDNLCPNWNIPL